MTFEGLAKKISPTLKRITYRLNGHFTFFNEDDLYQEAMIHLWHDFNQGKLSDKTDSYILQGCYFYLKNYIRTHRDKVTLVSLEASLSSDEERSIEEILPFQKAEERSVRDYFHDKFLSEAILNNGFTPREKEILKGTAEGLTTREIGSRLGISHVGVIKLMRRIKEKCRVYTDGVS